jgi:hypothetical protein
MKVFKKKKNLQKNNLTKSLKNVGKKFVKTIYQKTLAKCFRAKKKEFF